ncbi:MAG: hypothetical protein AABX03_04780 [Nanoarchaeota archaeon]
MNLPNSPLSKLFYSASPSFEIPENPALDIKSYAIPGGKGYEVILGYRSNCHFESCSASNFLRSGLSELTVRYDKPTNPEERIFQSLEQGIYDMFGDLIFEFHIFNNGKLDEEDKLKSQVIEERKKQDAAA